MEDLWAFNERIVADAIYTCTLPVVAAIGHETDTTIAELVADVRCATPTQAVMHLIPDAAALGQQVEQIAHRLALLMRRQLQHGSSRLDAVSRNRLFGRPGALIEAAGQQTNRLADVLERAMHQRMHTVGSMLAEFRHQLARLEPGSRIRLGRRQVGDADGRLTRVLRVLVGQKGVLLDALTRQLDGVGPRSVLGRGYSYTLDRDNQLIGSIKQVRPGQGIVTVVSDGRFRSTIDPSPAHRSRKTGHRAPQSQPSLFDHESP